MFNDTALIKMLEHMANANIDLVKQLRFTNIILSVICILLFIYVGLSIYKLVKKK